MKIYFSASLVNNENFSDVFAILELGATAFGHNLVHAINLKTSSSRTSALANELKSCDLVIADISGNNPFVMYEIGQAQTLDKPIILICEEEEISTIPFNLLSTRIFIYNRKNLSETLLHPIRNYLAHGNLEYFQQDILNFKKNKEQQKTVFVSYSHVDTQFLNRLQIHLKPFEREGRINLWADTKIKGGDKWKKEIENALNKAAIAVLLISADFLASDFIIDNELPPLLQAAEKKGTTILPVILKPCRFTSDKNLSLFQAINDPKTPLSKMDENDKEETYVKIANRIDSLLQ